jgi:MFS family permease
MNSWKRNLYILWLGSFLCSVGISMIIPFLPLYVQELGVHDVKKAALWSACIFSVNHAVITLVSPFWGRLSDRYGQKMMMVRSGIGMGLVIAVMGLAHSPLQLLLLRIVFGTVAGFSTSASALLAVETPKEHAGRALGTLQTGNVCGQLFGPLLGGLMAESAGMRNAFYLTGILILGSTILVIAGVRESRPHVRLGGFRRHPRAEAFPAPEEDGKAKSTLLQAIRQYPVVITLFLSSYLIAGSFQSIDPILTLYVQSMHVRSHVELMGGLIFAASALGTIVAAPYLGRLGDKWGQPPILLASLAAMSILYIPQATIHNAWVLLAVRFLTGLCVGGLMPSISSLLRRLTPRDIQGSVFGFNSSATSLGNVSGALFGGMAANHFGMPCVFYMISGVFFLHFVMLLVQFRTIRSVRGIDETSG